MLISRRMSLCNSASNPAQAGYELEESSLTVTYLLFLVLVAARVKSTKVLQTHYRMRFCFVDSQPLLQPSTYV